MPASGFFTSCAMAAAISPSVASRSRRRSRSSSCSTRVRSLNSSIAPVSWPLAVADDAQRVADHLARGLQAQLGAVRQAAQFEGAAQDPHDVRAAAQHVLERAGRCRRPPGAMPSARYAASFITAIAPVAHDREHGVAHARHDVLEERRRNVLAPRPDGVVGAALEPGMSSCAGATGARILRAPVLVVAWQGTYR